MNWRRLTRRGLYYVMIGLSLGSLPFTLFGFATIIYNNIILNTVFFQFFPSFPIFVTCSAIFLILLSGFLGYSFRKLSSFYAAQREIDTETDPYATVKLPPISAKMWKILIELAEKHGIDCQEQKRILEISRK